MSTEVRIPVPHGYLAAKTWGNPSAYPLLALHGWLDNANTFDRLVPHLPKDLFIVCLDVSGHGHSSHLGASGVYSTMIFYMDIKYVIEHFGWKKLAILGHSMGGGLALTFAALYPQLIEHVISLDHLPIFRTREPSEISPDVIAKYIEEMKKHNARELGPGYVLPKEDIVKRMAVLYANLSRDSLELLMDRGLIESEDKKGHFSFTRDPRCKTVFFSGLNGILYEELRDNILPNYHGRALVILASNSFATVATYEARAKYIIDVLRKNCSESKFVIVEGFHHFHMDNPEEVAKQVCLFLQGKISRTFSAHM